MRKFEAVFYGPDPHNYDNFPVLRLSIEASGEPTLITDFVGGVAEKGDAAGFEKKHTGKIESQNEVAVFVKFDDGTTWEIYGPREPKPGRAPNELTVIPRPLVEGERIHVRFDSFGSGMTMSFRAIRPETQIGLHRSRL